MSDDRLPAAVLANVPGWRDAEFVLLQGGLTNRKWLVVQGEQRAVLKIDARPRGLPFNTRIREATIQSAAAQAGLAAPVLYADETALLTAYVEGEVWRRTSFDHGDNIERLGMALRRLHRLPPSGSVFAARAAAERYMALAGPRADAALHRCVAVVRDLEPTQQLCFCHNDLVAENVVAMPEVRFLDWEYACDNDPLFDLATVIEHHDLDESLAGRLLDAYAAGGAAGLRKRLTSQRQLYRALYALWLAARPDAADDAVRHAAARCTV